jgi:hypothetical protein
MNHQNESYLGDGLYARDDGFMIVLRAPREDGDHWVGLEAPVLSSLLEFIEKARGVKISVKAAVSK